MIKDWLKIKEFLDQKVFRLVFYGVSGVLITSFTLLYIFRTEVGELHSYTIEKGNLDICLSEAATIKAVRFTEIRTPFVGGRRWDSSMRQIIYLVDEGTIAQEADTLIKFDVSDLLTQKEDYFERLQTARDQYNEQVELQESQKRTDEQNKQNSIFSIQNARLNLELAQFEAEATQKEMQLKLSIAEIDSKKVYTNIDAQQVIRRYNLSTIEKNIRDIQNDIRGIDSQVASYNITAPFSALVVYAESGWPTPQKIELGDTPYPFQQLLKLPDLSQLKAVIYINDLDREIVKVGQKGSLRLEAYPGEIFEGTISSVSFLPQKTTNAVYSNLKVLEVELLLDNSDEKLKPGMSAIVDLKTEKIEDAILVPLSAVFEIDGNPSVYLSDGKFETRQVEIGRRDDIFAEVLGGLEEGDRIIEYAQFFAGAKLGSISELTKRFEEKDALSNHFDQIEELGISYDYDKNRGKPPEPSNRSSRGEMTDDQIKSMLERVGQEATPENIERMKERIKQRGSEGGRGMRGGMGGDRQGGDRKSGRNRGGRERSGKSTETKPDTTKIVKK